MKKVFLLVASALLAINASAGNVNPSATLANPKGDLFSDGVQRYIVKWDPTFCDWAAPADANVEFDETFTFAVDISNLTDLVNFIAAKPNERTVGVNFWSNWGAISGLDFRLQHIKDNVYGVKINFKQYAESRGKSVAEAIAADAEFVLEGQFFGAGYAETSKDIWMATWRAGFSGDQFYEFSGEGKQIMSALKYTGTKASPAFTNSAPNLVNGDTFHDANPAAGGYAKPETGCDGSGIGDVTAEGKTIVGYYTILGVKLQDAPASGIFIEKYSDGSSAKIVK